MANTKKKLKKLKRKVKELQKLNCYTESRLDKLELDVELLKANKADYDTIMMCEDEDVYNNDCSFDEVEEELDKAYKTWDDGFVPDSDELRNEYHSKFGDSGPHQTSEDWLKAIKNASYQVDTVQPQ